MQEITKLLSTTMTLYQAEDTEKESGMEMGMEERSHISEGSELGGGTETGAEENADVPMSRRSIHTLEPTRPGSDDQATHHSTLTSNPATRPLSTGRPSFKLEFVEREEAGYVRRLSVELDGA